MIIMIYGANGLEKNSVFKGIHFVAIFVVGLLCGAWASFAEPAYCSVDYFKRNEIVNPAPGNKIKRLHVFKLGSMTLAGLGVGESTPDNVRTLARTYSVRAGKDQKYCTWYLNTLNPVSMFRFRWIHLPMPSGSPSSKLEQKYLSLLGDEFFERDLNFLDCAKNYKYIALGCNSMKHRGPTAFAMLLAFSGCSPDSATEIANHFWGENTIQFETRRGIARAAYDYGQANPTESHELQSIFEGN